MNEAHGPVKYVAFARIAATSTVAMSAASCTAGMAFFVVILGVFSSLWRAVARGGAGDGGRPEESRRGISRRPNGSC